MIVIAANGLLVPKEDKPREYISDTPPDGEVGYTVPDTAYYLRRLAEGDLVEVAAVETQSSAPKTTKKGGV